MFERFLTDVILKFAKKYINNINASELKLSLWGGAVTLNNIDLRVDVLQEELDTPFIFERIFIQELKVNIPWASLGYQPANIFIRNAQIVLLAASPNSTRDSSATETAAGGTADPNDATVQQLDSSQMTWVQSMVAAALANVEVTINGLTFRIEMPSWEENKPVGPSVTEPVPMKRSPTGPAQHHDSHVVPGRPSPAADLPTVQAVMLGDSQILQDDGKPIVTVCPDTIDGHAHPQKTARSRAHAGPGTNATPKSRRSRAAAVVNPATPRQTAQNLTTEQAGSMFGSGGDWFTPKRLHLQTHAAADGGAEKPAEQPALDRTPRADTMRTLVFVFDVVTSYSTNSSWKDVHVEVGQPHAIVWSRANSYITPRLNADRSQRREPAAAPRDRLHKPCRLRLQRYNSGRARLATAPDNLAARRHGPDSGSHGP
jgi:hypothetical protein